MESGEGGSFGESPILSEPPRPPPRDLNPFGEPSSPRPPPPPPPPPQSPHLTESSARGEQGEVSVDPPTPTTPPPPIPEQNGAAPAPAAAVALTAIASEEGDWSTDPPPSEIFPPHLQSPRPAVPEGPTEEPDPVVPAPASAAASALNSGAFGAAAATGSTGAERPALPSVSSRLTGRRQALNETRIFEQRRHRYFGDKFDGDSLYWKCFVELIRRSQANNRRAINYATEKLKATFQYAKALYAIRDHVDGLEAATTETRCEKERRKNSKKRGQKVWPPPQAQVLPEDVPHKDDLSGSEGRGVMARPASALDSLFMMEEHIAMRTLDMIDEAKVNVIDKHLSVMVKSMDDRFSGMVGQGAACLRLMHSAEMNTAKAYARYQDVVTESLNREATGAHLALPSREVASSDVWLADMNYRVSVTQQARVWMGVSTKLAELFGKMKDIEVERRKAIQSGLAVLMQLQDALWRDLPVLKDPVLQSLDRINVDRSLLDQEVRADMRIGAARLLADRDGDGGDGGGGSGERASSSTADSSGRSDALGSNGPSSSSLPPDFLKTIESPLDSQLIARYTMLERKDKLMIGSRWVLVLGVLTHDSYLLLFDVPKGHSSHKKNLNARTSEVFAELVPKPGVDAMATEISKHKDGGKSLDVNGLPIPPSVAIDLSACQVHFKPDGKSDATFEITEIRPAKGVTGVFKDYNEKKYSLRGRSQEAMVDWVCQIKEMGRAGLQAVSRRS